MKNTLIGKSGPEMTRISKFLEKNGIKYTEVLNEDDSHPPRLIVKGRVYSYKGESGIRDYISSIKSVK